ncbi:MAG: hypothetical protein HY720_05140 [Planctomycetes bacterium]|nr:hypothetical protein [Planctomycetota bacterium]
MPAPDATPGASHAAPHGALPFSPRASAPFQFAIFAALAFALVLAAGAAASAALAGAHPSDRAVGWLTSWGLLVGLAPLPHALLARPEPRAMRRQALVLVAAVAAYGLAVHSQLALVATPEFRRGVAAIGLVLGTLAAAVSAAPLARSSPWGAFGRGTVGLVPVLGSTLVLLFLSGVGAGEGDLAWLAVVSFPVAGYLPLAVMLRLAAREAPPSSVTRHPLRALGLSAALAVAGAALLGGFFLLAPWPVEWAGELRDPPPASDTVGAALGNNTAILLANRGGKPSFVLYRAGSGESHGPIALPDPPEGTTGVFATDGTRLLATASGGLLLLSPAPPEHPEPWTRVAIPIEGIVADGAIAGPEILALSGTWDWSRREFSWTISARPLDRPAEAPVSFESDEESRAGRLPVLAAWGGRAFIFLGERIAVLRRTEGGLAPSRLIDLSPSPSEVLGLSIDEFASQPVRMATDGERIALLFPGRSPVLLLYVIGESATRATATTLSPLLLRGAGNLYAAVAFRSEGSLVLAAERSIYSVDVR